MKSLSSASPTHAPLMAGGCLEDGSQVGLELCHLQWLLVLCLGTVTLSREKKCPKQLPQSPPPRWFEYSVSGRPL